MELFLDLLQLLAEREPRRDVQRGHGLVKQDRVGIQRQRSRNGDALLLSAGQRVGLGVLVLRQPHLFEQRQSGAPRGLPGVFPDPERVFHVPQDRHVLEQGVVLEDKAHVPPGGRGVRDVDAVLPDAACGGLDQADQHPQKGRFPAAGRSEDGEKLSLINSKRDVFHRLFCVECFR